MSRLIRCIQQGQESHVQIGCILCPGGYLTVRGLIVSHAYPPATMHIPLQPRMPPSNACMPPQLYHAHPLANTHPPGRPCTPPGNHHAPPSIYTCPPDNHACPPPRGQNDQTPVENFHSLAPTSISMRSITVIKFAKTSICV